MLAGELGIVSKCQRGLQVMKSLDMLLPALLDALNAPSEKVVVEALAVQASIAEDEARFRQLMQLLLDRLLFCP